MWEKIKRFLREWMTPEICKECGDELGSNRDTCQACILYAMETQAAP